jgi:hypothetical protein
MRIWTALLACLLWVLAGASSSALPTPTPALPPPPDNNFISTANANGLKASLQEYTRDPGSPQNWVAPAGLPAEDPYEYRTSLGCGNKASPDANDNPTNCTFGMTVCVTAANPAGVLYYSWIRRKDDRSLPWRFNGESCSLAALPAAPAPPAVPSLAQIREAFATLPFGKPTVSIQPVGGKTLVNLPTFYEVKWDGSGLEPGSISAPVQMLSWTVEFEVNARSYTFDFGDGTKSEPTTDIGGPYPTGGIRHTYDRAIDAAQVKVDSVLSGRYRINGGPWQDIGNDADLTDEPVTTLQVAEAQARLYSN